MSDLLISQDVTDGYFLLSSYWRNRGNTFALTNNAVIDKISVYMYREESYTSDTILTIKAYDGSNPTGLALATSTLGYTSIPVEGSADWVDFTLSSPITLNSSTIYCWYITNNTGNDISVGYNNIITNPPGYTDGGYIYTEYEADTWTSAFDAYDLTFKIYGTEAIYGNNDLIIYIPNNPFENGDEVYLPGFPDPFYIVIDSDTDWFKILDGDNNVVQYDPNIKIEYVKPVTDSVYTIISGLSHLVGETVYVLGDGNNLGKYTVASDGTITLGGDISVGSYIVGLPYTLEVNSMRLAEPGQPTIQSRTKRIHEIVTRVIRSSNGRQGRIVRGREITRNMNCQYSNESQDITTVTSGGYDSDGKFLIVHSTPEPFGAIGTVVSYDIQETR